MDSFHCFFHKYSHFLNEHTTKWVFIVTAFLFQTSFANTLSSNNTIINCTTVFQILESKGVYPQSILKQSANEMVQRYCEISSVGSCCNYDTESKLAVLSKMYFEKSAKESIGKLNSILATRAQKFNEFFIQLLAESKKEFHAMFKRTYGIIYEQNAYVFSDFFSELESYFIRGQIDLTEALDSFFNTLYQKLFTVLNSQYSFDDKYLGCISEHMKELKPFGDVPDKLSVQIKRSFVATRTYAQALNTAADVAKNLINVRPTMECTVTLTRMYHCGLCKGVAEKPCSNYCANVMKGCLKHYHSLNDEWENFILAMEKVSERLLGPFNIVMVVEPINIKISEAIMNFQETGQEITKQVFQGCGRPLLGLQKRHTQQMIVKPEINNITNDNYKNQHTRSDDIYNSQENDQKEDWPERKSKHKENDQESGNMQSDYKPKRKANKKKQSKTSSEDLDSSKETILDKLIKDIRQKVKDSKKFWLNLPYQICNNEEIANSPATNSSCWNGNTISSNGETNFADNFLQTVISTTGSTARQTAIVGNQLYYLKIAINHLRNAYNGQDVEWTDQEETYYGSGSGSGNGINEEDETSSGLGSLENTFSRFTEQSPTRNNDNESNTPSTNTAGSKHSKILTQQPGIPNTINKANFNSGMSFRRILLTYLLPVCVAWIGGIISDLL